MVKSKTGSNAGRLTKKEREAQKRFNEERGVQPPPRVRPGLDDKTPKMFANFVEQTAEEALDFVDMPLESRALLIYKMRLKGHSIQEIAAATNLTERVVRDAVEKVTTRMISETDELRKTLFAVNVMRLEKIISKFMPMLDMLEWEDLEKFLKGEMPEGTKKPMLPFDRDMMGFLLQAIKLELQIYKETIGSISLQQTNININHTPTMVRNSPLYDAAITENAHEKQARYYPEKMQGHKDFIDDPRIKRLENLLDVEDVDVGSSDADSGSA